MELDTAHSIEVITVSTSCSPGTSVKKVVPLHIDLERFSALDKDEGNKLRRPVRPIDRQRMRPWLMELLDLGNVFGLRWTNRHQGIFQISWRHASRLGWNLETDGDVFERWARHTGIYKEGDPPEPKRWKANFRCALHSLHDVVELTNAVERRGRNACRTYRFLQSNDEQSISRKRAKARRAKALLERPYGKSSSETVPSMIAESSSSEEIVSDTESEESQQDKVIVQKLDLKNELSGEDYFLYHDHDYAGPDKTQKTIYLRQGIGSIVLHKEVLNAPEETEEERQLLMSNLDQLASAAVSSASLESTPATKDCSKVGGERKSGRNAKATSPRNAGEIQIVPVENKKADYTLKHLLIGIKRAEDELNQTSRITRKRKSSTTIEGTSKDNHSSDSTSIRESRKTSELASSNMKVSCPGNNQPALAQSPPLLTVTKRTSSPKILCRRSKRHRTKSDESISESTEPLMSSCLLLLEAATRLDNEEKKSTSSLSSSSNAYNDVQNSKDALVRQTTECPEILHFSDSDCSEKKIEFHVVETTAGMFDKAFRQQGIGSQSTEAYPKAFPGILRSTLEKADTAMEDKDAALQAKAVKNLLKNSAKLSLFNSVSVSEGKLVLSEAPFAKGLFSGSTIQSNSQPSTSGRKRIRGTAQMKPTIQVSSHPANESCDSVILEEGYIEKERHVTFSSLETRLISPSLSTIKTNSGVQQLVIQRALPVLSPPVQKSASSRIDPCVPVMVTHSISHTKNNPQIMVSSDKSLNLSKVFKQEGSAVMDKILSMTEFETPSLPLSGMETGKQIKTLDSMGQQDFLKKNENVGSLVSVFSSPDLSKNNLSNAEFQARNLIRKPLSSIKIALAPTLRTVTLSMNSGVSQSSQCIPVKTIPVCPQTYVNIPVKSEVQTSLHSAATGQYVGSLKSSNALSSTLILSNSHSVPQKNDVFIYEQEKPTMNEVKLHVVPFTNSSQVKQTDTTSILDSLASHGRNNSFSVQKNSVRPVHLPAQVVLDPTKGAFLKISGNPNVFINRSLSLTVPHSPMQPFQASSNVSASMTTDSKQATTSITTSKSNATGAVPVSSIFQPGATTVIIPTKGNDTLTHLNLLNSQISQSQQVAKTGEKKEPDSHPVGLLDGIASAEAVLETEVFPEFPNTASSISLLHNKSHTSIGGSSSIVLDFQQALQAHKMTQALASVSKLSGELDSSLPSAMPCSAYVKPLAELCKRYLASLFSALDGQTSDSDENESITDSPKVKEESSSVMFVDQFSHRLQPFTWREKSELIHNGGEDNSSILPTQIQWDGTNTATSSYYSTGRQTSVPLVSVTVVDPAKPPVVSHESLTDIGCSSHSDSGSASHLSAPVESIESQDEFSSRSLMDPTAPLSIGEIPLFATSKSNLDSLSPND